MTNVSSLLIGWLTIASFIMYIGARAVMRRQIRSGESGPAVQLSAALSIHGFSSIPAFIATLVAGDKPQVNIVVIMLWTTWTGWLIAKTVVIKVVGRLELALCCYALWVPVWFVWRYGTWT